MDLRSVVRHIGDSACQSCVKTGHKQGRRERAHVVVLYCIVMKTAVTLRYGIVAESQCRHGKGSEEGDNNKDAVHSGELSLVPGLFSEGAKRRKPLAMGGFYPVEF
jgi:hypothetical protein